MSNLEETSKKNNFQIFLKVIKSVLVKNFGYKILSFIIALVVWAGLVSQAPNIIREKKFDNVYVTVTGSDTLRRNGLIVTTDLNKKPLIASFSANVPQMQYQNAKYSHYLPKIDLSGIKEPGTVKIPVTTSSSLTYGEVTNITPSSVELNVDTYLTQYRIPVQYEKKGEFNDGFYCTDPYLDPMTIRVSGPAISVKNVAKAIVAVDVAKYPKKEGVIKTSSHFKLVDQSGNEIKDKLIEVTSDSISIKNILVTQHQYKMKTYNVAANSLIHGEVQEGYYIKSIKMNPSIIFLAGNSELLDNMENLYADENIDVSNRRNSLIKNIKLNIPNEVVYASAHSVMVDIDIEPVIKEKIYKNIPINLIGKKDNLSYNLESKTIDVTINEQINILNSIKESNITAYNDVSNLKVGIYYIEPKIELSNSMVLSNNFKNDYVPNKIKLVIEEK